MTLLAAAAVAGYLIGTVSFSRVAAHFALGGSDISVTEYDVPGTDEKWIYRGVSATGVIERAGWKWGVFVVAADALKAAAPTLLAQMLFPDSEAHLVVAAAVVAGHVWPIWWGFLGGRGQSPLLGALLVIDFWAVLVAAAAGVVVGLTVFTSAYLAREMGPALLVPWFALVAGTPEVLFAVAINVIYWLASRGDIAQERKVRRARGTAAMSYPVRFGIAWKDFSAGD